MNKDIIIVFGFVIFIVILCKLWNLIAMKQYEKNKVVKNNKNIKYGTYINSFEKLELMGINDDGNSDFAFIQAVKKIDLSDDIRIKIYD